MSSFIKTFLFLVLCLAFTSSAKLSLSKLEGDSCEKVGYKDGGCACKKQGCYKVDKECHCPAIEGSGIYEKTWDGCFAYTCPNWVFEKVCNKKGKCRCECGN